MAEPITEFAIGERIVGDGRPVYIVAEMANAHQGNCETAKALVQAAAEAGADAIKIQYIRADSLVVRAHPRHAHFKRLEFYDAQWAELIGLAHRSRLAVLADVFDEPCVDVLQKLGVAGLKIHASDTCNEAVIRRVGETNLPVLLSAGGAMPGEIERAINQLRLWGACPIVLMHGYQAYPTDPADLHLRRLTNLTKLFSVPVGLQDHLDGDSPMAPLAPLVALGLGIVLVEKHLTLSRSAKGIDYYSSLNPAEFRSMVERIRSAEVLLGHADVRLSVQETAYRRQVRKVIVASGAIRRGERFRGDRLCGKRADGGLPLEFLPKVIGRDVRETVPADQPIRPEWVQWRVVVMIAARMHSTRLPGKALAEIVGKPAIAHLIARLKRAQVPSRIVLCTSTHPNDAVLRPFAEEAGIGFFAGSEDDVMDRFLGAAEREGAEHLVRVTGDDLLVDPDYLDRLVLHHIVEEADYSCAPGLPKGTECEVVAVEALRKAKRLAEDSRWSEYMTWYLKVPEVFRVREMEVDEAVRRPHYRLTLDYPQDLEAVRRLFATLPANSERSVQDIVRCLDSHPEIVALNAEVPSKPLPPGLNVRLRKEDDHAQLA